MNASVDEQALPEAFLDQVKDALNHLYDFAYLERHALTQELDPATLQPGETPGQRLRRALVAAIETLNPGKGVPFRSPRARLYHLLVFHWVEGMTVQEAARELSISRRQAHRHLQQGVQSIAAVLRAQRPAAVADGRVGPAPAVPGNEIAHLDMNPQEQDMCLLLQQAQQVVEPLARQRGQSLAVALPPHAVIVSADPVMARQVLINTLSHAVEQAAAGRVSIVLTVADARTSVRLSYTPAEAAASSLPLNSTIAQIAQRLGWVIAEQKTPAGDRSITIEIPAACPCVLVIDDNQGFLELMDTYLAGHACRLLTARNSQQGFQLAIDHAPDAIILDVMMPQMDGWEFLQRLRNHPQTAAIPVIVCSVINNPELAYALGASAVLPKPVSQSDLLTVMKRVGIL